MNKSDLIDAMAADAGITKAAALNGLLSPLERQEAIERVESGEILDKTTFGGESLINNINNFQMVIREMVVFV